jgi:hypothetical protein
MRFFRLPFASQLQIFLLVGMILGFLLIGQNLSLEVYKWGLLILMASAFVQIVAGNIPPETRLIGTLIRLALGLAIVVCVFLIGIWLVPYLARLGGGHS